MTPQDREQRDLSLSQDSTQMIKERSLTKVVNGGKFTLKMIDTPGYGRSTDLDSWRKQILDYIKGHVTTF
jgi:septin family protein